MPAKLYKRRLSRGITVQGLSKAPLAVQRAVKERGKPLSKLTRYDWYEIACELAPRGVIEAAFSLPREWSLFHLRKSEVKKGPLGRPVEHPLEMKRRFVNAVEKNRFDERGKRLSDAEILRRYLKRTRPGLPVRKVEREIRLVGARLSRWRREVAVADAR